MEEVYKEFTQVFSGVKEFDEEIWFKKSWNTFSRTLILNQKKKNQLPIFKENIKKEVFKHLDEFPLTPKKKEIEDWYESFLTKKDEILTLGQRQKLLNILIKYFVVYEFLNEDSKKKFTNSLMFLHIPIDKIVLNRFSLIFENSDVNQGKLNGYPWSKLNNYEDYIKFQNLLGNKLSEINLSPLEFEMKFLWVSDEKLIKFYLKSNNINVT